MHINPTTRELAISINLKKMGWKMNNIRFIIRKKNEIKIVLIILY